MAQSLNQVTGIEDVIEKNAVIVSDPDTPLDGAIRYDNITRKIYLYDGSAWEDNSSLVYVGATYPSTQEEKSLWFSTEDYCLYVWDASAWHKCEDAVVISSTEPYSLVEGQLWYIITTIS